MLKQEVVANSITQKHLSLVGCLTFSYLFYDLRRNKLGVSPKLATVAGFDDLHYEWSAKGPAAAQATMVLQWEISMVISMVTC